MKTCSPHQFHEKKKEKNADFVLYTRDECAVVCEFCVFYLCENVSPSTKKERKRKEKKNNSIHLGPFLPLTAWHRPMINQITATPNPKKKCLAQCFPSHVFYLRKKQPFGFTKKAKSQNRKTPNCHKNQKKTRMKEKKKSSKQCLNTTYSHTRLKLHYIYTLIHQNFILKYHPCHQINQSTKPPILDFYSSLIAVPKH